VFRPIRIGKSFLPSSDNELTAARVSEYERDIREPSLFTLLRYAQVARVLLTIQSTTTLGERKMTSPKLLKLTEKVRI